MVEDQKGMSLKIICKHFSEDNCNFPYCSTDACGLFRYRITYILCWNFLDSRIETSLNFFLSFWHNKCMFVDNIYSYIPQ